MNVKTVIKRIDRENFHPDSLKDFVRHQVVGNVYRLKDGRLTLRYCPFEEDWSPERKLEKAEEILSGEFICFGAFLGDRVVGEIMLVPELEHGRMIVDSFHVSGDCRRQGIGRSLFEEARGEALRHGARALYASACSAQETIDFYLAMGFAVSPDPIAAYAEDEPCDIQMECPLG